jgi:hypothetical protein
MVLIRLVTCLRKHSVQATTIIELLVASLIVYLCYILFLLVFIKLNKPQFGSLKLKYYYEAECIIDSLSKEQNFVSSVALSNDKVLNIDIYPSQQSLNRMIVHGYVLNSKDTIASIYRSVYKNDK